MGHFFAISPTSPGKLSGRRTYVTKEAHIPTYPQSWGLKPAVVRAPGRKVSVFSPLSEIGRPVSGWVFYAAYTPHKRHIIAHINHPCAQQINARACQPKRASRITFFCVARLLRQGSFVAKECCHSNNLICCCVFAGLARKPCTHARTHILHARTHARMTCTHTRLACTHARLACTRASHVRTGGEVVGEAGWLGKRSGWVGRVAGEE